MFTTIISTEDLAAHLNDPTWVVMDCRFDLARPDWGFQEYQSGHIPGSGYAHLDKNLSGPVTLQTGRHPLPDIDTFARRLGAWGINSASQVVVYDHAGGAYAGRLWWLLRFLGHSSAAVLDGGLQKWLRESRPLVSGFETRPPAQFNPKPDWSMVANTDEIERIHQNPEFTLIDARSAERFRGETEPIDPVAGHIPGAVNRFHGQNLGSDGTFLPAGTLRDQFARLIDQTPAENVVVYCGSGVTSIHHILAMELAGMPGARLYPGSWSEWIRDRKRPIS